MKICENINLLEELIKNSKMSELQSLMAKKGIVISEYNFKKFYVLSNDLVIHQQENPYEGHEKGPFF